jgi:hypothetical protein
VAGIAVGNLAGVIGIHPEEAAVVEQLKAGSDEAFAWLIASCPTPATLPILPRKFSSKYFAGLAASTAKRACGLGFTALRCMRR